MTIPFNHTVYEFAVRNESGEDIPAFAVMQPIDYVGAKGRLVIPVVKPGYPEGASGYPRFYLINGPYIIPAGGSGNGTRAKADNPAMVLRRKAPPLTYGEDWGAVDHKWYLDRIYAGGYCALGKSVPADDGAEEDETTKSFFHSEGITEPFLVEIGTLLEADDQPGEGQIMEQGVFYEVPGETEEDPPIQMGGEYVGIGRNIPLWWPAGPAGATIGGKVWVQRNARTGAYNLLDARPAYTPPS